MASDKVLSIPPVAQRDKASFEVMRVWFLARLLEGFQAEIDNPTDEPEGEVTQ